MFEPQISVVMPAYNAEKYLTEAIDSILSQTFSNFEFIIINDASTDSTKQIIEFYNDPRIKLINNEQNKGVAKSLNIGISFARGKYIARMDSDDIAMPTRLQTQFDFMEKHPNIDICGSWVQTFGAKTKIIRVPRKHVDIKDLNFFSCAMLHPTIIFKTNTKLQYLSDFPRAEDYDLWCREINNLNFANIPEALLRYRIHKNQIGELNKLEQNNDADGIRIRNLKNIGIVLPEEEKMIYLRIINGVFIPKNKKDLNSAIEILNIVSIEGTKFGYKKHFLKIIQNFIMNIAKKGFPDTGTFLRLYFTKFRRLKSFETTTAKLRYTYYLLRKIFFHV